MLIEGENCFDKASEIFDRNQMVQAHTAHAHLPVDVTMRKNANNTQSTRLNTKATRPGSAQVKGKINVNPLIWSNNVGVEKLLFIQFYWKINNRLLDQ